MNVEILCCEAGGRRVSPIKGESPWVVDLGLSSGGDRAASGGSYPVQ